MSVKKHGDMFVATARMSFGFAVFKHRDRMTAMKMASSFVWSES